MLVHHTHERLAALGLAGMAKAFTEQLALPDSETLTFEQRLGLMIDREATERDNRRLATRLKFAALRQAAVRSEEHTSELPSLMRISYAVFCLKKKKDNTHIDKTSEQRQTKRA